MAKQPAKAPVGYVKINLTGPSQETVWQWQPNH